MSRIAVVGSGAAGMTAACVAADTGAPVVLVTDRGLGAANSGLAQGGIHVPVDDEAGRQRMVDDILAAAGDDADRALVRRLVDEAVPTVRMLESWGLELSRDPDGTWRRRLAGGMSEPRIVGADDRIGRAVSRVLRSRVGEVGVEVRTGTPVRDVEARDGGLALLVEDGEPIAAGAVVLATGGATWERAEAADRPSTNPPNDNASLRSALAGMGLEQVDADRWQYQPFGLVDLPGGATVSTVPETIVEHEPRILDRHGEPVVDVHAGRLRITEAMHATIETGDGVTTEHGVGCLLTLSDVPTAVLRDQFPATARLLERTDLLGEDVVVRPALHYQLGGFRIRPDTSTSIPGLFLAGEMTGGAHGRNRLMGVGLLESLVTGRRAGRAAARHVQHAAD